MTEKETKMKYKKLLIPGLMLIAAFVITVSIMGPVQKAQAVDQYSAESAVLVIPVTAHAAMTAASSTFAKIKMPFKATILSIRAWTSNVNLASHNEHYDLFVTGDTHGNLVTPFDVNTPAAVQDAGIINSTVNNDETVSFIMNTSGTSPSIANATVFMTVLRRN